MAYIDNTGLGKLIQLIKSNMVSKSELQSLDDYCAEVTEENVILGNENNTLRTRVVQLEAENSTLTTENRNLTSENTRLSGQVSQLTSQVNQLNTEVSNLNIQISGLQSDVAYWQGQANYWYQMYISK